MYTVLIYILAALIVIWRVRAGYKAGLVAELSNAASIVIALGVGFALKNIIFGFTAGRYGAIVIYVVYLAALLLIYKIVSFIFASLKIFAKLPVIKLIDKLFGIILGVGEGFIIIVFLVWFFR